MVFGCISKNFPENIFWCLEKKKGKHKSRKTQATTQKKIINDDKSSPTTASSIAIHSGVWFIQIFLQKMHQIRQKKPKPSKRKWINDERRPVRSWCDERRATSGAIVDRAARSRRSSRSSARCDRRTSGAIWPLSLSLSLFGNDLKWKWGCKIIFGSKVKILVNRKPFSGKWNLPLLPNT